MLGPWNNQVDYKIIEKKIQSTSFNARRTLSAEEFHSMHFPLESVHQNLMNSKSKFPILKSDSPKNNNVVKI